MGFNVLDAPWVHENGIDAVIERTRQYLGDNPVYLTFDIDCLDPSYAAQKNIGPYLQKGWQSLAEHPLVGEARMVGLMGALELVKNKQPVERFDEKQGVGTICRDALIDNGLVLRSVGDTIVCAPPLTLTHEEADELLEKAWKCLDLTQQALDA